MKRRTAHGARRRGVLIPGLLGTAFLVVALLLAQAWNAVRTHRAIAQRVLHEHAQFAADRYVANLNTEYQSAFLDALIAFQGWYPGDRLPDPDSAHLRSPYPAVPEGAITYYFSLDPVTEELTLRGSYPGSAEREWVRSRVAAHAREIYPRPAPYAVLTGSAAGKDMTVVYRRQGAPARPGTRIVGFGVDPTAFRPLYDRMIREGELLPVSVTADVNTRDLFRVMIRTPRGTPVYRSGYLADAVATSQRTSAARAARLTVVVGLSEGEADALVAGGLPRFRVSVFLGLLALTTLLVGSAVLLLRREAHLTRMRQEFVSNVSHELRTPLTQIRMFAETLLLRRFSTDQEEERALQTIDQESRRLTDLVENVLSFAQLSGGRTRLTAVATDLDEMVRGVVEGFQPLARARECRVECTVEPGARAILDRDAFRRVLLNLLDNSLKYGPSGQTVQVRVSLHDGWLSLTVDDEGPGVAPGDRGRIWERYSRASYEEAGVAGTGIGLSVVRELTELQGGEVEVGDAPGGGARFVVRLPADGPVPRESAPRKGSASDPRGASPAPARPGS